MEPAMILQKRQSVITMECYQRGSEIPNAARNPYALVKNLQELLDVFYDAILFQILIYPKISGNDSDPSFHSGLQNKLNPASPETLLLQYAFRA